MTVHLDRYYYGNQTEKEEMGREACGTHGELRNAYRSLVGNLKK